MAPANSGFIVSLFVLSALSNSANGNIRKNPICNAQQYISSLPPPQDSITIVYRLFPSHSQSGTIITSANQIPAGQLFVITHGADSGWKMPFPTLVDKLLKAKPASSAIFIDWQDASESWYAPHYSKAISNMYQVSKIAAAQFFRGSTTFSTLSSHCIGDGLGAHLCGMISVELGQPWDRLSALDPSGSYFSTAPKNKRVDISQARYVDAIHTDARCLGISKNVSHSDFWPNEGQEFQPGCSNSTDLLCSHSRALSFFIESINPPVGYCFPSCSERTAPCLPENGAKMGFWSYLHTTYGAFYGNLTSQASPFTVCEPQFCNPEKKLAELPSCDRNFALVLDISKGMSGNRFEIMKRAAIEFIDMADDMMSLGVVTYHSYVNIIAEAQRLNASFGNDLKTRIKSLRTGDDDTCIVCGLERGVHILHGLGRLGGHIILLTSGDEISGWVPRALDYVDSQKAQVHTIAIGSNADKDFEQLADSTQGERYFLADGDDLSVFIKIFGTILQNAASSGGLKHVTVTSTTVSLQPTVPADVPLLLDSSLLGDNILITAIYEPNLSPVRAVVVPSASKIARQQEIRCEDDSTFNKLYCRGLGFKLDRGGLWTLRLESSTNNDTPEGLVTVTVSAVVNETVQKQDTISLKSQVVKKTIGLNDTSLDASRCQFITASLSYGDYALLSAQVKAIVESEKGQLWSISLLDDGQGHDWQANDGIYTGAFRETSIEGRYRISVFANAGPKEAFYMPQINLGYLPGNCLDPSKSSGRQYIAFQRVVSGATFSSILGNSPAGTPSEPEKPPGYGRQPSVLCSNAFGLHLSLLALALSIVSMITSF